MELALHLLMCTDFQKVLQHIRSILLKYMCVIGSNLPQNINNSTAKTSVLRMKNRFRVALCLLAAIVTFPDHLDNFLDNQGGLIVSGNVARGMHSFIMFKNIAPNDTSIH